MGVSVILTTMVIATGLKLAHVAGLGPVLKQTAGAVLVLAELVNLDQIVAPAVILWDDGPIVCDDGELCYPLSGWPDLKEANG